MHKVYENKKVGNLEQNLSKTLTISMILIFLGTKFHEFYKY